MEVYRQTSEQGCYEEVAGTGGLNCHYTKRVVWHHWSKWGGFRVQVVEPVYAMRLMIYVVCVGYNLTLVPCGITYLPTPVRGLIPYRGLDHSLWLHGVGCGYESHYTALYWEGPDIWGPVCKRSFHYGGCVTWKSWAVYWVVRVVYCKRHVCPILSDIILP